MPREPTVSVRWNEIDECVEQGRIHIQITKKGVNAMYKGSRYALVGRSNKSLLHAHVVVWRLSHSIDAQGLLFPHRAGPEFFINHSSYYISP